MVTGFFPTKESIEANKKRKAEINKLLRMKKEDMTREVMKNMTKKNIVDMLYYY